MTFPHEPRSLHDSPRTKRRVSSLEHGFTIIELVVTLGLGLAIMGIAVSNLREYDDPLIGGAAQLSGFFKQVRARAISTTEAYHVAPVSSTKIVTRRSHKCIDTVTTLDPKLALTLPTGAYLVNSTWNFCYTARGFPDANIELDLRDSEGKLKTIEVMLGGAVRIQE